MRMMVAAGLALALMTTAGAAEARPFTAKDLATLDRVSDPQVSPDGRWVAYSLRTTDWDGNKGVNALWLLDRKTAGAKPMLLSGDEKAPAAPRWSADGKWLYFLSFKSGSRQVWRMAADRSGKAQVTALPLDVGFYRVSADGRTLVVGQDVYPDCADLDCTKARDEAKGKEKTSGQFFDGTAARAWDSYQDEKFVGLYTVRLDGPGAPASAVPLTKGYRNDAGDDAEVAISKDGKTVWFAALPSGKASGVGYPQELYAVPADGSTAPLRIEGPADASDNRPTLSPDGTKLAFTREVGPVMINQRTALMIRDIRSGAVRDVAPGWDISLNSIAWAPDGKTLYATAQSVGQVSLFGINVASGKVTPVVADGTVSDFDVAGGTTVYVRDSLTSNGQIYDLNGGSPRALTEIGKSVLAEAPLAPAEQFSFSGWNGETVHGYVIKPAGYEAGKTYPVAFLIHGGPHGSFGNAWSYRWNPQVWAGMGYAVVMIDFHGSTGYGVDFAQSIVGHWGDRPLEDLQKGWAAALGKYSYLDGDRACALGGSYGGYMVAWIASQWQQPWKCLVNHAGLFDTRTFAYATDIPGFSDAQFGGDSWSSSEPADRFNPALHVKDWKTPMLVIHGARDYRVPLDQGIGAYTANQRMNVPTQYLHFPDENHWVLKPQNSVQWYATVEAWMGKWTAAKK
ncbi:MAG: S9 family peptidase [Pseudomonadota bacterium]